MAYSAKPDLLKEISEEQLIQLTDDEGTGIVNEDRVTAAIAKADALIDSICVQLKNVPFTTVPAVIKQHSVTISLFFLFARRSSVPEIRIQNYRDAISHLKDIAIGKASLAIAGETGGDDIQGSHTVDDKTFSKGKASDGSSGSLDNY